MPPATVVELEQRNRCIYCLQPHDGRGRCCHPDCERRTRGKVAYITRSRRRAVTVILEQLQETQQHSKRWRDIAMGRDVQLNLLKIFGSEPGDE